MYYVALYDHGNMSRFLGFSTNKYIAELYAKSDDMANVYVEEVDCDWEEFRKIVNKHYTGEYIGEYEDRLQVMVSEDGENHMITSPKEFETVIYESGFVDTLVENLAETLISMLYMAQFFFDEDVSKFIYYIIQAKYPDVHEAYQKGLLTENPNYHLDLVKALCREGFIGTVK